MFRSCFVGIAVSLSLSLSLAVRWLRALGIAGLEIVCVLRAGRDRGAFRVDGRCVLRDWL